MKRKIVVGFLSVAMFTFMLFAGTTNAYIPPNTPDATPVAVVPGFGPYGGVGTLANTNVAYDPFNFTEVPWVDVTAANLAQYKIVVLYVGTVTVPLNTTQQTDLMNWVSAGGKLIMYDAEVEPGVDWTWLIYPFNTSNPGPLGGVGSILNMEDNTLGQDNNPSDTFYYINTTIGLGNYWADVVGDANTFTTFDIHWCGDIQIINNQTITGWAHAYARYGDGLMIYNGFDTDFMYSNTVPGPVGIGGGEPLAKIWLLELYQPWGTDYNLPCGNPVVERPTAVGGYVLGGSFAASLWLQVALAIILALATTVIVRYRLRP